MPKTKDNSSKVKQKSNSKKSKPRSASKKEKNNFEDQFNELQDRHIRLKAEFDNFRRRKSEEISKLLQYDGENVIVGFLPIKIGKYFEKLNVEPFGEQGDKMDTDIHDAMLTQSDEKYDDDIILEVFERGYTYRDKVIRHAKVIVNKK